MLSDCTKTIFSDYEDDKETIEMKILFVVSDFDIGGITSALKNLTNELIIRGHQVDILNMPSAASLPEGFNANIGLIQLPKKVQKWNLCIEDVKGASLPLKIFFSFVGIGKKLLNKKNKWIPFIFHYMQNLDDYDVAIAFRQDPADYYVVKYKTNAKRKVGFWHGDPDYMGDTSSWDSCVYDMDCIAGVSNAVCENLLRHYPKLKDRIYTVYNIFDKKKIIEQSKEYKVGYSSSVFNIVTVSRLGFLEPKMHQRIPSICKKLKAEGREFHWTIVGDGEDRARLEQQILESDLENEISMIGPKSNPYPYIKQAELFVLTSSSESYGMVVMESLILGTPVVAGDYPALKEILSDECGIRADNSTYGIYLGVKAILDNKLKYKQLKENCLKLQYSTDETYQQFLKLCGE